MSSVINNDKPLAIAKTTISGKILANIAMILVMTSCSTQSVKQDAETPASEEAEALNLSKQEPPLVSFKGNQTLNLVRIMDGAVCKNDQQGAKGEFLLYADPKDLDRIKQDQGEKIFRDFEQKIEIFSANVFEQVISNTTLTEDPFALGDYEAHQKLAQQVADSFKGAIANDIDHFQQETGLPIDIVAFPSSFVFYHKGCDLSKMELPE